MGLLDHTLATAMATLVDVAPIVAILFGVQFLVIRRRPPNLRRIAVGFVYVLVGLTLFLVGLEEALFPIGKAMAQQLRRPLSSARAPAAATCAGAITFGFTDSRRPSDLPPRSPSLP